MTAYLDHAGRHITGEFKYDTLSPLFVTVRFGYNEFAVPRDYLADALMEGACPLDDCRCDRILCLGATGGIWLDGNLKLYTDGPLPISMERLAMWKFLKETFARIPRGREFEDYDWDSAHQRMLRDGGEPEGV
ncbi:hypothetical protein [Herbidospora yilanensis]|uniref:hypothetical protein n=1 Tax=Herbidospora yilanensis TaxID=354426 RepID=UPI000785C6F5|nr:hypothetical protein [Herbidospora yilanensis]